jgi:hypothetical protein
MELMDFHCTSEFLRSYIFSQYISTEMRRKATGMVEIERLPAKRLSGRKKE